MGQLTPLEKAAAMVALGQMMRVAADLAGLLPSSAKTNKANGSSILDDDAPKMLFTIINKEDDDLSHVEAQADLHALLSSSPHRGSVPADWPFCS